jgi:hypothetical protein
MTESTRVKWPVLGFINLVPHETRVFTSTLASRSSCSPVRARSSARNWLSCSISEVCRALKPSGSWERLALSSSFIIAGMRLGGAFFIVKLIASSPW